MREEQSERGRAHTGQAHAQAGAHAEWGKRVGCGAAEASAEPVPRAAHRSLQLRHGLQVPGLHHLL